MACPNHFVVDACILSLVLLSIILLMAGVCLCVAIAKGERNKDVRTCGFYIACILGIAFLIMVVVVTGLAFNENAINGYKDVDCHYSEALFATVGFSYGLVIFFCFSWVFCFCLIKEQ